MPKIERKIINTIIQYRHWLFLIIATVFAFLARKSGMDYISGDMEEFLVPWYEQIVQGGGFRALSQGVGDYNVLYQTLICLFSYIPLGSVSPMYLYKAVSIFFDFFLAAPCAWIVSREKEDSIPSQTFCTVYSVVLMIPTIILNSAVWGQCDSMYTAFCILSLYWLYKENYLGSFVALGIAFDLKLQTVFILPVYIYYYISRQKFSLGWFLVTIGTFWATGIPAYLAGRPLTIVFGIYRYQTIEYKDMIRNSLSVWYYFFPKYKIMNIYAILLTIFFLGLFLYYLLNKGRKLKEDPKSLFTVAAWSAWTCLLFLPAMHDRYGYLLDAILVLLCFFDQKLLKCAAVQLFGSGIVYTAYLCGYKWSNPAITSTAIAIASLASVGMWLMFTFRTLAQCCSTLKETQVKCLGKEME